MKKYYFSIKNVAIALCSLLLLGSVAGGCAKVDFEVPVGREGDQGDQGPKGDNGKSVYDKWLDDIKSGKVNWDGEQDIANFFKWWQATNAAKGVDGKDPYTLWKEEVAKGGVTKYDPFTKKDVAWDQSKTTLADYWLFLAGAKGETGRTPKVVTNPADGKRYWSIDGKITTTPATPTDGTDAKPMQVQIQEGLFVILDPNRLDSDNRATQIATGKTAIPEDGQSYSVSIVDGKFVINSVDKSGTPHEEKLNATPTDGRTPVVAIQEVDGKAYWFIDGKKQSPAFSEIAGSAGRDGINGQNGKPGPKGQTGDKGETGDAGKDGKPGAKGEKGDSGQAGSAGKDGLKGRDGANGKSAYDLWKAEVDKGVVKDPKNPTKTWPTAKNTKADFFEFLTGPNGADGENMTIPVILGYYNVIPQYFSAECKEYVRPLDGCVLYRVYDKEGNAVPAGVKIMSLPGLDTLSKTYTTDANGEFYLDRKDLPEAKPLSERRGVATVEVNGKTEQTPKNTLVLNRVHIKIIPAVPNLDADKIQWGFTLQRSINGGEFKPYPSNFPDAARNKAEWVLVKDVNKKLDDNNTIPVSEWSDHMKALRPDNTSPLWLYRPVIYPEGYQIGDDAYNPSLKYNFTIGKREYAYGESVYASDVFQLPPVGIHQGYEKGSMRMVVKKGKVVFWGNLNTDITKWAPFYKDLVEVERPLQDGSDLPALKKFPKIEPTQFNIQNFNYRHAITFMGKTDEGAPFKNYCRAKDFNPFKDSPLFKGLNLYDGADVTFSDYYYSNAISCRKFLANTAYKIKKKNGKFYIYNKWNEAGTLDEIRAVAASEEPADY